MSAKFHVNNKGEPGKCSAEKGYCPFGSTSDHYDSLEDARTAYESKMGAQTAPRSVSKEVNDRKFTNKMHTSLEELKQLTQSSYMSKDTEEDLDRATDLAISINDELTDERYQRVLEKRSDYYHSLKESNQAREIGKLQKELKHMRRFSDAERIERQEIKIDLARSKLQKIEAKAPHKISKSGWRVANVYEMVSGGTNDRIRHLVKDPNLSDKNLRKLAEIRKPEGVSDPPYDLMYDHPNASEETREILLEKNKKVKSMKKMDELSEKHGDLYQATVVPEKTEMFTTGRGYTVTKTKFDKKKLEKLNMNSTDVHMLMKRSGKSGQMNNYDEHSGIYKTETDSSD